MDIPFDTLVNLKPVDDGTTYIVNDLTGLTPAMIDFLKRDDSLETVEDLWLRTKTTGYERLKLDFEATLSEKRDFNHEMAETYPPKPDAELAFQSYSDYVGAIVEMCYNKHTNVEFNQLVIWAESAGTCSILVHDKRVLKEISRTNNISITPGINFIDLSEILLPVKSTIMGMELFVGLKTTVRMRPMDCNLGFGGRICNVAQVYSYQVNPDKPNLAYADFIKSSVTWPVHLVAKVVGDIDDMMQVHKKKLAPAFQYLCGHLLLTERLKSENFNTFTNTLADQMEEQAKTYEAQYKSHLIKAIKTIYTTTDDSKVQGVDTEHQGGWFQGSYV